METLSGSARIPPADRATLLDLARETLARYLTDRPLPEVPDRPALKEPRAVFVTLRRRDNGELRGCRGETTARRTLGEAVVLMAITAAADDPRFRPVTPVELPLLHIEISALSAPRPIRPDEIVVGQHGLILRAGVRAGLLLPQVPTEYGWDRDAYLAALCRKAGLPPRAWESPGAELEGFTAEVWGEDGAVERE
ncbi:MAG: AmmeMemoRadiSam system protein A [Gemmatimonadota bacterium]|jgi:AmmeMemoRadiSam system protein A